MAVQTLPVHTDQSWTPSPLFGLWPFQLSPVEESLWSAAEAKRGSPRANAPHIHTSSCIADSMWHQHLKHSKTTILDILAPPEQQDMGIHHLNDQDAYYHHTQHPANYSSCTWGTSTTMSFSWTTSFSTTRSTTASDNLSGEAPKECQSRTLYSPKTDEAYLAMTPLSALQRPTATDPGGLLGCCFSFKVLRRNP